MPVLLLSMIGTRESAKVYGNEVERDENMAAISKLDYLKKYMSSDGGAGEKKGKKKRQKVKKVKNIMIIDNDVKFRDNSNKGGSDYDDEFDLEEEKPQVYFDGNTLLSEYNEKNSKEKERRWAPVPARGASPTGKSNEQANDKGSLEPAPRKHQRHDILDASPNRKDSSPDLSPPRNRKASSYSDKDLYRKRHRHDSPDDAESGRNHGNTSSPDLSPPRNRRKSSSSDLSPERLKIGDHSPSHRRKRQDSLDLSPERKQTRQYSPDLSPPRNRKDQRASDLSPRRVENWRKESSYSRDLSPERQKESDKTTIKKESHKWQRVSPEVVASGNFYCIEYIYMVLCF